MNDKIEIAIGVFLAGLSALVIYILVAIAFREFNLNSVQVSVAETNASQFLSKLDMKFDDLKCESKSDLSRFTICNFIHNSEKAKLSCPYNQFTESNQDSDISCSLLFTK